MKNCIDESILQAWFDGQLAPNLTGEVATHLNACSRCREAMQAIEAESSVLAAALSAEFAQTVPTERLRQRVDAAVAGLHVLRPRSSKPSRWQSVRLFFASFRPVAYASVAAAILLLVFVAVVFLKKDLAPRPISQENRGTVGPAAPQPSPEPQTVGPVALKPPQTPPPHPLKSIKKTREPETPALSLAWQERQYEKAIARLNEAIQTQPPLRPSLKVEYEFNLALIDNAIATTREAAKKKPNDPQATQFVLAAYQSKIDLMNQIAEARVLER